jgi:glutamyl-tRNA reductase
LAIVKVFLQCHFSEHYFMHGPSTKDITKFYIAGINYKKSDAVIRGQFAVSNDQYATLLSKAPDFGLHELFVLSTCNRTEIYGFAESADQLINLLCSQTEGSAATFTELAYIKNGLDAIEHLFSVAAGLDSQILGDYEIVGQIKQAVKFSKECGFTDAFMERLVNCVLQASKAIKNQTNLSGGTVSVSFAAVQYIREKVADIAGKKIVLLGVGKIGRNTCKNLVDYLDADHITLINRTEDKAAQLADELNLHHAPLSRLAEKIEESDIILVATNSVEPTIKKSHLEGKGEKLIIDLSVPFNVEEAAQELPNVHLVNVDELAKMKDETLQMREAEVPKARNIIQEHIDEFLEWFEMRKHVPVF